MMTEQLLDEAVLNELREDTEVDDITPFLIIFMTELKGRCAAISTAAAAGDLVALGHEIHTLKSGAASFGAQPLYALAVDINACCKRDDLAAALVRLEALLSCAKATLATLEQRCSYLP